LHYYVRSQLSELLPEPEESADGGDASAGGPVRVAAQTANAILKQVQSDLDELCAYPPLPDLPGSYGAKVGRTAARLVAEAVAALRVQGKSAATLRIRLTDLLKALCTRQWRSPLHAGVVFAGFGNADTFPSVDAVIIDGRAAERLKWFPFRTAQIDFENDAVILPFGQQETMTGFVRGVEPSVYDRFMENLDGVLQHYLSLVTERAHLSQGVQDKLAEVAPGAAEEVIKRFGEWFDHQLYGAFEEPVLRAVAALPKHELARMAESLVRLRSFRLRVDAQETDSVGGSIDVAVISKRDGFTWVRRRRYFDVKLNPARWES